MRRGEGCARTPALCTRSPRGRLIGLIGRKARRSKATSAALFLYAVYATPHSLFAVDPGSLHAAGSTHSRQPGTGEWTTTCIVTECRHLMSQRPKKSFQISWSRTHSLGSFHSSLCPVQSPCEGKDKKNKPHQLQSKAKRRLPSKTLTRVSSYTHVRWGCSHVPFKDSFRNCSLRLDCSCQILD